MFNQQQNFDGDVLFSDAFSQETKVLLGSLSIWVLHHFVLSTRIWRQEQRSWDGVCIRFFSRVESKTRRPTDTSTLHCLYLLNNITFYLWKRVLLNKNTTIRWIDSTSYFLFYISLVYFHIRGFLLSNKRDKSMCCKKSDSYHIIEKDEHLSHSERQLEHIKN